MLEMGMGESGWDTGTGRERHGQVATKEPLSIGWLSRGDLVKRGFWMLRHVGNF